MPDINIAIKNKTPIYDDISIVCDNSDYVVVWDLDEEWAAYDTKAMHLTYSDGTHAVRIFSGQRVALPVVTVPGKVGISLYAGDISTSREALITAKPSGRTGCDPVPDPGTGVYEQLLAALNDKVPKDQGAENAGKVLGVGDDGLVKPVAGGTGGGGTADHSQLINRDKADQHPMSAITGLEGALEGKQAKGDYITADGLQDATDAALAQAKASGAFDGPQGAQGPQGPAGAGMDISGAEANNVPVIASVGDDGKPVTWSTRGIVSADNVQSGSADDLVDYSGFQAAVPLVRTLNISGAAAGQIPIIAAVDEGGRPTAWGAADMPGGTDLSAVEVYVADFAHDEMTVTAGAVDKYARVVVS